MTRVINGQCRKARIGGSRESSIALANVRPSFPKLARRLPPSQPTQ